MATGTFIARGVPGSAYRDSSTMGVFQSREQRGYEWTPSKFREPHNCSVASLENARYHLDGIPTSDHPNEDRHFAIEGNNFCTFGVFDGHDGPKAAGFASNYILEVFNSPSWQRIEARDIPLALEEFFKTTDKEFFRSIKSSIDEKEALQSMIPPVCWLTLFTNNTVPVGQWLRCLQAGQFVCISLVYYHKHHPPDIYPIYEFETVALWDSPS